MIKTTLKKKTKVGILVLFYFKLHHKVTAIKIMWYVFSGILENSEVEAYIHTWATGFC